MIADTITDIRNPKTNSLGNIGITPNPTSGIVNVPSSFIGNDFELIDLQGQKRFEILLSSTRVDLSRLSEGLYLARIKTDNGYYVEKISIIR